MPRLLDSASIRYHQIESRAKSVESFGQKVIRPGKTYTDPLSQITDLVGVRVILNHLGDIDRVLGIVDSEFEVDDENSVDKSLELGIDQFGYLTVHRVVRLTGERIRAASEWSDYEGIPVEIQVRTVLQHAWATVSHELQYKTALDIPNEFKRKLIRVAGLLELADEQFVEVRRMHDAAARGIPATVFDASLDQPIDLIRVGRFIENSAEAERILKLAYGRPYVIPAVEFGEPTPDLDDRTNDLSSLVAACNISGIRTTAELGAALSRIAGDFPAFLDLAHGEPGGEWYMDDSFIILLAMIAACPDRVTVDFLTGNGFAAESAQKIHIAAMVIGYDGIEG
ncbi:MAG: hypothetical protein IID31_07445 [Planctomycetes bacterium]|nr:hypothetical protein [Planctomycetota bacterium]